MVVRSLNKAEDLRLIADYRGEPVTLDNAAWALEQSGNFCLLCRSCNAAVEETPFGSRSLAGTTRIN